MDMAEVDTGAELDALIADCRAAAKRAWKRGKVYYLFGYLIMLLSLVGSIGAGALALASGVDRAIVGFVALVPAFAATIAGQLRLVEKSNWFYRRRRELDALARRTTVARMRAPTLATLEHCYAELTAIDRAMGDEWSEKLAFDFTAQAKNEAG
jgi:hypothetical protein